MSRRTAAAAGAGAGDVDEPPARRSQTLLRAVNRDLRGMGSALDRSALAELARQLARRVDDGDERATAQLRSTLGDLYRLSRAGAGPVAPPDPPEPDGNGDESAENGAENGAERGDNGANPLETIGKNREIRRAKARRRGADRSSTAPDMDGTD